MSFLKSLAEKNAFKYHVSGNRRCILVALLCFCLWIKLSETYYFSFIRLAFCLSVRLTLSVGILLIIMTIHDVTKDNVISGFLDVFKLERLPTS